MKSLIIVALLLALVSAIIGPVSVVSAAGPEVVGEVIVEADGTTPAFSGDIKLLADGTIQGGWAWTLFQYNGYSVKFFCNELSSLSFSDDHTASFTGKFTSNDLPLNFTASNGASFYLSFVITSTASLIGTAANPSGLPVALPPHIALPSGVGPGGFTMIVHHTDGSLIATQRGYYEVNVY